MRFSLMRSPLTQILLGMLVLAAPGCGGGGSSGGGSSSGGSSTQAPAAGSVNAVQWQTALDALAASQSPDPVALTAPSIAVWNGVLARTWPRLVPRVQTEVEAVLRTQIGQGVQGVTLQNIRNLSFDILPTPQITATPSGPPQQTVNLELPHRGAQWNLYATADIGGNVLGAHITTEVNIQVAGIEIQQPMVVDLSDPDNVHVVGAGTPHIRFQLLLSSPDPIVSTITGTLTQLLDPIILSALIVGATFVQDQVGLAAQSFSQGAVWGLGGPGLIPVPAAQRVDLEQLADDISDEIQRNHIPFGQLYKAIFDT
ncbi:MAG: hypothetical protein ACYTFT_00295, partial [Planctomycetota bacterium]